MMTGDGMPIKGVDIFAGTDSGASSIPRRKKPSQSPNGYGQNSTIAGIHVKIADSVEICASSKKRTATEALDDASPSQKRSKMDSSVISIDDTDNGAILIDDD